MRPRYFFFKSAGFIGRSVGRIQTIHAHLDQVVDDRGHRAAGMKDHLCRREILDLPEEALLSRLDVP
jgi:hypothetical protein